MYSRASPLEPDTRGKNSTQPRVPGRDIAGLPFVRGKFSPGKHEKGGSDLPRGPPRTLPWGRVEEGRPDPMTPARKRRTTPRRPLP